MVKCINCENLKQVYLATRYCEGKIINAEVLHPEKIGLLTNYDFECDFSDKDCLSRKEIHEERECSDFEQPRNPNEPDMAASIPEEEYQRRRKFP